MAGRPPLTPAKPFGARLAALRKSKGWTQPKLAQKLEITLAALIYYERKAENPSAAIVSKAASVFGVTVDELLGIKPLRQTKPGPVSMLHQKVDQIAVLPRATQQYVLQFLDQVIASAVDPSQSVSQSKAA